jgi:hypothetical protein
MNITSLREANLKVTINTIFVSVLPYEKILKNRQLSNENRLLIPSEVALIKVYESCAEYRLKKIVELIKVK